VDVRAIILVGAETEAVSSTSTASPNTFVPEQLVGVPIAALDLVGQPVVCHVIDRLRNCGVSAIIVLSSVPAGAASLRNRLPAAVQHEEVSVDEIWGAAEGLFLRMSKDTADAVLIMRMGPYTEVDFNQLLKSHLARRNCATSVTNQFRQPLDIVALDSAHAEEAAIVIRRRMQWNWRPSETLVSYGYFNALRHGQDFRSFTEDALMRRCALIPKAREVRPGVWLGRNARLHDTVRVEGPVFVGERAKIRKDVVLRGYSAIESGAQIDTGTLVGSSTVLPQTYIGKHLNLVRSVAGFSQIVQIDRNVTVHIADERLTKTISAPSLKKTWEPVRSSLFLVKRTVSANLARLYSNEAPVQGLDLVQPSANRARAHAAAASASRNPKRAEEDPNNRH